MSSTNRGAVRDLDDHYATPPDMARLICQTLRDDGIIDNPSNLLEPGCGEGTFLDAMRDTWPAAYTHGVELDPTLAEAAAAVDRGHIIHHGDFVAYANSEDRPDFSAAIGNPPFKDAERFIRLALKCVDPDFGVVAFILRLNFLGSQKRFRDFWKQHPPAHVYVFPARVGFTADGKTDSCEYAVFVWKPGHQGEASFAFLDNRHVAYKWDDKARAAYPTFDNRYKEQLKAQTEHEEEVKRLAAKEAEEELNEWVA